VNQWKIYIYIYGQSNISALEELKVPKCMSDLKDKKANKGGKTFFHIKIRSDPPPTVTW
jgi:hypothetical protein